MAKLAIKGHATRGNEVIELLEMLGGINIHNLNGNQNYTYYIIDSDKEIKGGLYVFGDEELLRPTLEEFLEKFPYKVGDKVQHKGATSCGSVFEIEKMRWVNNNVEYTVRCLWHNNGHLTFTAKGLQPYKEETMDKVSKAVFDANAQCCDITNRLIKEETMEEKSEQITVDIPNGYDFFGIDDNNKIVLTKKQLQYPKTYEECCKVLNIPSNGNIAYVGDWVYGGEYLEKHLDRLRKFQQLLICRDAYWKMAGDQMGLGKPWEPNLENEELYCIQNYNKYIITNKTNTAFNKILIFPTIKIRDAFYENFKELIESCKELL